MSSSGKVSLFMAEELEQMIFKALSNPNDSMILLFPFKWKNGTWLLVVG